MSDQPRIPMLPSQLPVQRTREPSVLPEAPPGFRVTIHAPDTSDTALPRRRPRSAHYLGQVEWAWSPMSGLVLAMYLSMDRSHRRWVLWHRRYDDNWMRWEDGQPVASAPRSGLTARDASLLLLAAAWRSDECRPARDAFHWVNENGLLDGADFGDVASVAWPEERPEDPTRSPGGEP
jgi:hypothetical protein